MLGLSYDLLLCFKSGAILEALHGSMLGMFAYNAPTLEPSLDGAVGAPATRARICRRTIRPSNCSKSAQDLHALCGDGGVVALALCIGAAIVWIVRG